MNWINDYFKAFGSMPFMAEPSSVFVVEDENGTLFKVDEPEQVTVDRIRRSKEVGRNLFFEELEPFDPYPDNEDQY